MDSLLAVRTTRADELIGRCSDEGADGDANKRDGQLEK